MSPLTFTPAREQDAALLVQLYNAAFQADYERYGECPAYGRTVEQMQGSIRRFSQADHPPGRRACGRAVRAAAG